MIDLTKLKNVVKKAGKTVAQCPACAAAGADPTARWAAWHPLSSSGALRDILTRSLILGRKLQLRLSSNGGHVTLPTPQSLSRPVSRGHVNGSTLTVGPCIDSSGRMPWKAPAFVRPKFKKLARDSKKLSVAGTNPLLASSIFTSAVSVGCLGFEGEFRKLPCVSSLNAQFGRLSI
jgi:hypothetical protein